MPYGASRGFNLYSPTFVQKMNMEQINEVADAYGHAVELAIEAGFDAVEIHAGHGYLISQFLSPYTNHRRDEFGGSLENRMRFMKMCVSKAVAAGKGKVALFAVWTFANLGPRAKSLTEKYEKEFGEEYTRLNKKHIIPFIW